MATKQNFGHKKNIVPVKQACETKNNFLYMRAYIHHMHAYISCMHAYISCMHAYTPQIHAYIADMHAYISHMHAYICDICAYACIYFPSLCQKIDVHMNVYAHCFFMYMHKYACI